MDNREKAVRDFRTKFNIIRSESTPDDMNIEGYFILYEQEAELWPGAYEIITHGALDDSLNGDIRALWNHNSQYVLGRTKSNTLQVSSDNKGLFAKVSLPNTQYARDLYELVQRGDVDQASFGFNIIEEDFEELADGNYRWRINKLELHEISVVTFPAYENTSVQARAKQVEQIQKRNLDLEKQKLLKRLEGLK